jgi:hypothetical protein
MPRKPRREKVSIWAVPTVDSADRNASSDREIVQFALVDFDELKALPTETREQLISDLVAAIGFFRAGLQVRKRGVSDRKVATQVLVADIGQALERAGVPAKRWYDRAGRGSLYFRVVAEIAGELKMVVPKDLELAGQRAAGIEYGAVSKNMALAQALEVGAISRGTSPLADRCSEAVDQMETSTCQASPRSVSGPKRVA